MLINTESFEADFRVSPEVHLKPPTSHKDVIAKGIMPIGHKYDHYTNYVKISNQSPLWTHDWNNATF